MTVSFYEFIYGVVVSFEKMVSAEFIATLDEKTRVHVQKIADNYTRKMSMANAALEAKTEDQSYVDPDEIKYDFQCENESDLLSYMYGNSTIKAVKIQHDLAERMKLTDSENFIFGFKYGVYVYDGTTLRANCKSVKKHHERMKQRGEKIDESSRLYLLRLEEISSHEDLIFDAPVSKLNQAIEAFNEYVRNNPDVFDSATIITAKEHMVANDCACCS